MSPQMRRMLAMEERDAAAAKASGKKTAAHIDEAVSAKEKERLLADQKALDRELAAIDAKAKETGRPTRLPASAGRFVREEMASVRADARASAAREREQAMQQYFTSHEHYVDDDGSVYAASWDAASHEADLERTDEKVETTSGAPAQRSTAISLRADGTSSRSTTVTAREQRGDASVQHTVTNTMERDRAGSVTSQVKSASTHARHDDGTTETSLVRETYDGREQLVRSETRETVDAGSEHLERATTTDFAGGEPSHEVTTVKHSSQGATEHTTVDTRFAGGVPTTRTVDTTTHADEKPGASGPALAHVPPEDRATVAQGTPATDTTSHEVTTFDARGRIAGQTIDAKVSAAALGSHPASTTTQHIERAFRDGTIASEHSVTDGTTHATDDRGHAVDTTSHTVTDVAFTAAGAPTRISTVADSKTTSVDDNGKPMTQELRSSTLIDAHGAAIDFDRTGDPTNATPRVETTLTTTVTDKDDDTRQTQLVQHGTSAGGATTWDSLRVVATDFDEDMRSIRTRDAFDYDASKLDSNGMPRTVDGKEVEGTAVDDMHVDNRSWWDQNKHWVATGLQVVGGVLSVLPTGVTQVIGGAMLIGGSAIALSDDLPNLINHPSWQGALTVGLDVVGGVAGVGSIASTFARGSIALAEGAGALNAGVRGTATLAQGVSGLNASARVLHATTAFNSSLPMRMVGYAGLANQGVGVASRALEGELTAEDLFALAGTVATIGAARFAGANGSIEIPDGPRLRANANIGDTALTVYGPGGARTTLPVHAPGTATGPIPGSLLPTGLVDATVGERLLNHSLAEHGATPKPNNSYRGVTELSGYADWLGIVVPEGWKTRAVDVDGSSSTLPAGHEFSAANPRPHVEIQYKAFKSQWAPEIFANEASLRALVDRALANPTEFELRGNSIAVRYDAGRTIGTTRDFPRPTSVVEVVLRRDAQTGRFVPDTAYPAEPISASSTAARGIVRGRTVLPSSLAAIERANTPATTTAPVIPAITRPTYSLHDLHGYDPTPETYVVDDVYVRDGRTMVRIEPTGDDGAVRTMTVDDFNRLFLRVDMPEVRVDDEWRPTG